MKKADSIASFLFLLFLLNACTQKQYTVTSISGNLVEMNNRFDSQTGSGMFSLVQGYKTKLDMQMNEVVGEADLTLTKAGSQSLLANFTADAMQDYATGLWGTVDFAVINNGGLRATLNRGPVTVGNLYEIYAFENYLVLLELSGKTVKQLFDGFAQRKIEGFSKDVRLTIKNNEIESIIIGKRPLDDKATYRVVTVDYLAEGNDGMEAFTKATRYLDSNIILRNAMIEYAKKLKIENIKIHATPDDRIEIKQ